MAEEAKSPDETSGSESLAAPRYLDGESMPPGTSMRCKCGSIEIKITSEELLCKICGASGPNLWKPKKTR